MSHRCSWPTPPIQSHTALACVQLLIYAFFGCTVGIAYFQIAFVGIYPNQTIGIYRWSNGRSLRKIIVFHLKWYYNCYVSIALITAIATPIITSMICLAINLRALLHHSPNILVFGFLIASSNFCCLTNPLSVR